MKKLSLEEVLYNMREKYQDKFTNQEDLDDFIQDIAVHILSHQLHIDSYSKRLRMFHKYMYNKRVKELKEIEEHKYSYTLGDLIDYEDDYYEKAVIHSSREDIDKTLKTLTPRLEKTLRLRFGLDDGIFRDFEELGKCLGVCSQRARVLCATRS